MKTTKKTTLQEKGFYYEELARIEQGIKDSIESYNRYYEQEQAELDEVEKQTREEFDGDFSQVKEALAGNWSYQNTKKRREEYGLRINALNQILDSINEM